MKLLRLFLPVAVLVLMGNSILAQEKPNMTVRLPKGEAVFTEEQLKDYYAVYEDEAVRHVRKIVDRFLKNPRKLDDETEYLKLIDKVYLSGRFNVLSRDPDMFGNTHVLLIAVDKPDKVFVASVYSGNGYRLERFEIDTRFNSEDMRRIQERYKRFLADKKHSL